MSNESGSKHEQDHEQFGPGEPMTTHLYLQILETEEEINKYIDHFVSNIVLNQTHAKQTTFGYIQVLIVN